MNRRDNAELERIEAERFVYLKDDYKLTWQEDEIIVFDNIDGSKMTAVSFDEADELRHEVYVGEEVAPEWWEAIPVPENEWQIDLIKAGHYVRKRVASFACDTETGEFTLDFIDMREVEGTNIIELSSWRAKKAREGVL